MHIAPPWRPRLDKKEMVKTALTKEMIDAGERLVRRLDQTLGDITASFWFYEAEYQRWRLMIGSPTVRTQGPKTVYTKIEGVLRKEADLRTLFSLGDISVLKDTDPLVKALRIAIRTGPGMQGIRFTGNTVNGRYIDDAYIYRVA